MSRKITIHKENKPIYDIVIEKDYQGLPGFLSTLNIEGRKALIITDSNIGIHYSAEVVSILEQQASFVGVLTLPPGEEHKELNTIHSIYRYLIEHHFDRTDILFALGGGVVGDMTGFAAATYLRGISFVQLPTTLLSMVDSSIGGKTGVDFEQYKNMVGAFHQPKAVYISLHTLNSLPDREFYSGFGEIIKHGLILNKGYYAYLKEHAEKAVNRDFAVLEEIIFESCRIKQQIVEEDPYETGRRALLNFGHSIGHAIEKTMNFSMLHGECVAAGIAAAAYISCQRSFISTDELNDIVKTLEQYRLSATILLSEENFRVNSILEAMKNDKKVEADTIKFILLKEIGDACIDRTVTEEEMVSAIKYIMGVWQL